MSRWTRCGIQRRIFCSKALEEEEEEEEEEDDPDVSQRGSRTWSSRGQLLLRFNQKRDRESGGGGAKCGSGGRKNYTLFTHEEKTFSWEFFLLSLSYLRMRLCREEAADAIIFICHAPHNTSVFA